MLLPSPKMPAPEASTEYSELAFFGSSESVNQPAIFGRSAAEKAFVLGEDAAQDLRDTTFFLVEQAEPVGVHPGKQWLVVEQLGGPFDGVDLGDLRRDDQACDLVQTFIADVPVSDHLFRIVRVAQPRIGIRHLLLTLAEVIDEVVVLAREQVVIEAHADIPVGRKTGGLLSQPLRLNRAVGRVLRA